MAVAEKVTGSDVVLLWFDEHIGKAENCIKLKEDFESNTTSIYLFHEVEPCRQFIKSISKQKLFCIIQGKYAKTLVPDIEKLPIEPVVYIFCLHVGALSQWGEDYDIVLNGGIFDHEQDLLTRLTQDLANYASLKAQEYRLKREACDEWAQNLTKKAKRMRYEQCTLPYRTDPTDPDRETPCEQPEN